MWCLHNVWAHYVQTMQTHIRIHVMEGDARDDNRLYAAITYDI